VRRAQRGLRYGYSRVSRRFPKNDTRDIISGTRSQGHLIRQMGEGVEVEPARSRRLWERKWVSSLGGLVVDMKAIEPAVFYLGGRRGSTHRAASILSKVSAA
jgi:hypothetical protein